MAGLQLGVDLERVALGEGPTPVRELSRLEAAQGRAMELLAEREGVVLDPVYTAKAFAALLELNRAGAFDRGPVVYWHTYGNPDPRPGSAVEPKTRARAA